MVGGRPGCPAQGRPQGATPAGLAPWLRPAAAALGPALLGPQRSLQPSAFPSSRHGDQLTAALGPAQKQAASRRVTLGPAAPVPVCRRASASTDRQRPTTQARRRASCRTFIGAAPGHDVTTRASRGEDALGQGRTSVFVSMVLEGGCLAGGLQPIQPYVIEDEGKLQGAGVCLSVIPARLRGKVRSSRPPVAR